MKTNHEMQQAILNNIPDQAWMKDCHSRYILVNEAFMAACRLPKSAILQKTPDQVWPREWGRHYIDSDQDVIKLGQRLRYEEWRYGEDGTPRWFDTIKTPIRNHKGDIIGTAGISRDITDRKQAEQELAKLNRFYAVRSKTNQAIARMSERDPLFQQVCRVAVQSGGLQLAWIGMFAPEHSGPISPVASCSGRPRLQRILARQLEQRGDGEIVRLARSTVRRLVCNDTGAAKASAVHATLAAELGFASFAAFPLLQGGERVGVFMLYAAEPGFFTRDIVQLLEALATDLSFALDFLAQARQRRQVEQELLESRSQLRELSAYLQSVREEERTRIARELHDELGQSLTAIRIGLGVIESQPMAQKEWRKNIHSLKQIADSTLDSVQRIAADLRPLLLDELGLADAIEWLLESFSAHGKVAYELLLPGTPLEWEAEVCTAIFRIIQESLTNVSRHGHASLVVVELKELDGMILLKITDNGRGIDPASESREKSLGMIGMRERAYLLGGTLKVQSRPGAGTSIEVRLPVQLAHRQDSVKDAETR